MSQENSVSLTPQQPVRKRNIKVIALTIICVILAASLVGVIAVYQQNFQSQIAEKDNTISSLTAQIETLQAQLSTTTNASVYVQQIAYLYQELSDLNDTLTSAYENLAYYGNITQLGVAEYLVYQQAVNPGTDAFNNRIYYAGYIAVYATSTSNTTYAQMLYSSYGVNFNQTLTLGQEGSAVFPVLPGPIEIVIGNSDQNSETATVTIIYHY